MQSFTLETRPLSNLALFYLQIAFIAWLLTATLYCMFIDDNTEPKARSSLAHPHKVMVTCNTLHGNPIFQKSDAIIKFKLLRH